MYFIIQQQVCIWHCSWVLDFLYIKLPLDGTWNKLTFFILYYKCYLWVWGHQPFLWGWGWLPISPGGLRGNLVTYPAGRPPFWTGPRSVSGRQTVGPSGWWFPRPFSVLLFCWHLTHLQTIQYLVQWDEFKSDIE